MNSFFKHPRRLLYAVLGTAALLGWFSLLSAQGPITANARHRFPKAPTPATFPVRPLPATFNPDQVFSRYPVQQPPGQGQITGTAGGTTGATGGGIAGIIGGGASGIIGGVTGATGGFALNQRVPPSTLTQSGFFNTFGRR